MRIRLLLIALFAGLVLAGCQTMPAGGGTATDYYERGRSAYTAGNYSQAIAEFQQATRLDPRFADAYFGLGQAYEATNQDRQALSAYLSAIRIQPSHGEAQARAGIIYFRQRQYGPAETHLLRATTHAPADPLPFYYLGEIYRMQGKCQPSVKMFRKALALDPNLLDAKDGLRRAQREICGGSGASSKPKPKYEKASEFTGGGRALTPDEW
ncbi:tetratricopeptide repeat protein [Thiohalocapsa marina]|uniref:Tetratricopeptide repeat protein n=1 Tax=Thiohalocapsa marina TaxID=424902 RepID=A0A5M8FNV5_9GAMM|nr:tetratricopeptide repeat protein [Thiohalocapsa marina]KAA6184095.1 tetratricopeptide repeat protein [Thiohalocapsa marina]